jgi:phage gp45-like
LPIGTAPVDIKHVANAVRMMVTRAKVSTATLGPRTLLQVKRFDTETFDTVELLHPFGYVALPVAGSDVLHLHVGGLADHKVAVGGDATGTAPADLGAGEFGLCYNGQQIILRNGYIQIKSATRILLDAPVLQWTPDGGATLHTFADDAHVHISGEPGSDTSPPLPGGLT